MNDKKRKYSAEASVPHELLNRYPTYAPRIEEELVYRLTDPIVKEAIKCECIVRFTETEQRKDSTTDLINFRKHAYIEEIVRCKDCKYCAFQLHTTGFDEMFQHYYCCTLYEQFTGIGSIAPKITNLDGNDLVLLMSRYKRRADDYCSYGEKR